MESSRLLSSDSFFYRLQANEASWSVALWSEEHLSVMFFPELQDAPSGVDAINSIRFPREVNFMVHGVWWRTLVCQKLSTKGLPLKKQPLGNISFMESEAIPRKDLASSWILGSEKLPWEACLTRAVRGGTQVLIWESSRQPTAGVGMALPSPTDLLGKAMVSEKGLMKKIKLMQRPCCAGRLLPRSDSFLV